MWKANPVLKSVVADWLINLSVFWVGVVIVSPVFPGIDPKYSPHILTFDFAAAILSLYLAYKIRKDSL